MQRLPWLGFGVFPACRAWPPPDPVLPPTLIKEHIGGVCL